MRLNTSAVAAVALLAGACTNDDHWTAIDAYLEADKTYHAEELGIAFLKDVTPEERADLFRAHQAAHPDASAAASAARAIIDSGGKRSIEAAEFLIEHPAHAKLPTTATDISNSATRRWQPGKAPSRRWNTCSNKRPTRRGPTTGRCRP